MNMKNMVVFALKIIVGGFLAIFLFVLLLQFVLSIGTKKLICTSNEGNITLIYNNEYVTNYTSEVLEYDLKEQSAYSKEIGIDAYIDEFSEWFRTNTTGSCKK